MAKARGSASSLPSEEEEEFRAIVEQVFRLLDVEKKGALDAVAIKVRYSRLIIIIRNSNATLTNSMDYNCWAVRTKGD